MKREIIVLVLCVVMFSVQFPIGHTTFDMNLAVLPDLIVTDFWQAGAYIYYQVMNIGDDLASGVHADALFIDNDKTAENIIDRSLMPGERYEGMFPCGMAEVSTVGNPDVSSSPLVYRVMVQTDIYNSLIESNETNNSLEKIFGADSTPPAFLSQPAVDNVNETSAVISWLTDECSDSLVEYGKVSGIYDLSATSPDFVTDHNVTLNGLEASTTYHFIVQSTDRSGNTARSGENTFETGAIPDFIVPTLSIASIPSVIRRMVNIQADASDEVGLEKVEFSMDDKLVFTAYSAPYTFQLDTSWYENGPHKLTVNAFDLAGNPTSEDKTFNVSNLQDKTIPLVTIDSPEDGSIVSHTAIVNLHIIDDVGLDSARFYVNGSYSAYDFLYGKQSVFLTYEYDVWRLKNGTQLSLAVKATDTSGNLGYGLIRVFVYNKEPGDIPHPCLEVIQHNVSRSNNLFTITLGIKNTGGAPAFQVRIVDAMRGFQPISANLTEAIYLADGNPKGDVVVMAIKPKMLRLEPGESQVYVFYAVPFLSTVVPKTSPQIGNYTYLVWSDPGSGPEYSSFLQTPIDKTTNGESIPQAHAKAVGTCDYLIVTNPYELYQHYDPTYYSEYTLNPSQNRTDVNTLLSTMAKLARYKQGTLGYFTWINGPWPEQILRDTIQNSWGLKLTSDWTSNGYLLIVGEHWIIPTWQRKIGTFYTTKGYVTYTVPTDYPYASTYGEEEIPELSIARIIGNTAKELTAVITTSLDVYLGLSNHQFDRSDILAASGFPGSPPNDIDFKAARDAVLKDIAQKFPDCLQHLVHTPDFTVYDSTGKINWTKTNWEIQKYILGQAASDMDVIFLTGHGSFNSWDGITTWNVMAWPNPFGAASPVVYAYSCNTGMYFAGFCLAEAFLQNGAAVYLGATYIGLGNGADASKKFFASWDTDEPVSLGVKQTKIALGNGDVDKVWRGVFHVYGDAKFGATPGMSTYSSLSPNQPAETLPPSSIDVTIPDYIVTRVDGKDYVEIPTGLKLLEQGMPQVPYYKVLYEYPKGFRIQDVALTYRSEPVSLANLNIPNTVLPVLENGATILPQSQSTSEWYPDKDFEWEVYEGPDSTTLAITIYPFSYNPLTLNANFYKEYSFNIDYIESNIRITALGTDKQFYDLGEDVRFNLGLENTGLDGKDVVVSAIVKEAGLGQFTGGFPLRTLKSLMGKASYSSSWSTAGIEPGDYSLIVELRDTRGILLDRRIEGFRIASDSTPPDTMLIIGEPSHTIDSTTYLSSATPISLIAEDNPGGSGVSSTAYRIRNGTYNSGWATYSWSFCLTGLSDDPYFIDYYSTDFSGNREPTNTATVFLDNTPPSLMIETPLENDALQDGVTFKVSAWDVSAVASVTFSIQCPQGNVISPGYQSMPATLRKDGKWSLYFDTRQLPDGFYLFVVNATDVLGNWNTETVPFSIRNWARAQMLPSTPNSKAGRTMPIKFSIRVNATVDPTQPFIYNEELTIKIYKKASSGNVLLQTSTFGSGSTDYRIDPGTLYITNFKTLNTQATYVVNIYRKGLLIGGFQFSTTK